MTTTDPPHTNLTQSPLTELTGAARRAEIVRLKDSGKTFPEIAKLFGVSKQAVHESYWKTVAQAPQEAVNEMRARQNARLEMVLQRLEDIADRKHVVVSGGEIVKDPADGMTPMRDSGPELQALRDLRATVEAQAKLNGTAAPAQVTVNGQISYVINNVDMGNLS